MRRSTLGWFPFLLLFLPLVQALPAPDVKTLSFNAEDFRAAFNASTGKVRLVGIYSPTCAHCLQACSQIEEILKAHPDLRVKVFILWTPFMRTDNINTARRATGYLADHRVEHFWDLWRYTSRCYVDQLKIPEIHAWDMVVGYKPLLVWKDQPPDPTFWLQNRGLDTGVPFSKEKLQEELLKWSH